MPSWKSRVAPERKRRARPAGPLLLLAALAVWLVSPTPAGVKRPAPAGLVELGRGFKSLSEGTGGCVTPAEQRAIARNIAKYHARFGYREPDARQPRTTAGLIPYPFFPQAGNVYDDLFSANFVDLDSTTGILDWDCTDWTYDGHQGNDVTIHSFTEQAIGVPVFAALDGTVVDVHDGEFDQETAFDTNAKANYVILYHGGTQYTWYYHFRKNSITVAVNQQVKAGTPLGMTGSSGYSTYPHLHFQTMLNNQVYEPYAGTCRPGPSGWVNQIPIRRDLYLEDFVLSDKDPANYQPLPFDMPRTGTFVKGAPPITLRFMIHNIPASTNIRFRFSRPDGTVALDTGDTPLNNAASRFSYYYFRYIANLSTVGTWHVEMLVNGTSLITAPLEVVDSAANIANRPPFPLDGVTFDPPQPTVNDVVFCRLPRGVVIRDPDYDVVRYRYQWTVNGNTVRDVTTAGRADAIPLGTLHGGETLNCTVTPSDGTASAVSSSTTVTIPAAGFTVSGKIMLKNAGLAGVSVSDGATTTTTAADGTYSFPHVTGTLTITPTLRGYAFAPASQAVTVTTADKTVPTFQATAVPIPPVLTGFTAAATVKGGKPVIGTLTFDSSNHVAIKVPVTSSSASVVGKTISVAKNKPTATVSLSTKKVTASTVVTLTASYAGVQKKATVTVTP